MDTLRGGGAENVLVAFIFAVVRRSWMLVRSWMLMVASGWEATLGQSGSALGSSLFRGNRDLRSGDNGGGGGPALDSFPSSITTTTLPSASSSPSLSPSLRLAATSDASSTRDPCSSASSDLDDPSILRSPPPLLCMSRLSTDLPTRTQQHNNSQFTVTDTRVSVDCKEYPIMYLTVIITNLTRYT